MHAIVFCINFIFMMIQNSHKMFGLRILKLIMYYIKIHYSYGLLHHLFIKIIITNGRTGREQNHPPSSGLLHKYIVIWLVSSLTQTRVKATDSKDTSETTCCNLSSRVTLKIFCQNLLFLS